MMALAAVTLGCAQVAGIQDISGSIEAQHCVDSVNQLRTSAGLGAVTRWLSEEQCADETATIAAAGGQEPPCTAGLPFYSNGASGTIDPDTFLQSAVNDEWSISSPNHGTLGETSLKSVACGYNTASGSTGAALLFED
jgi:hypothetical protein